MCIRRMGVPPGRHVDSGVTGDMVPHTKTAVMLVIYYHSLSMESKYTDQVYLDLCLFIPAVKNTGIPNSPRDTTGDAKST